MACPLAVQKTIRLRNLERRIHTRGEESCSAGERGSGQKAWHFLDGSPKKSGARQAEKIGKFPARNRADRGALKGEFYSTRLGLFSGRWFKSLLKGVFQCGAIVDCERNCAEVGNVNTGALAQDS